MRRLITTTLLIFIITGINGQLLFNPQGGGPPFGHHPLLMPGQKPAPVNSPFADSYEKSRKKPSSSDGFDDLIRVLQQPKSIWGDDDGDGDDNDNDADSTFPLFGSSSRNNNNHNNRFPFGNGNPFGEGLLGDRRKLGEQTSGGKKLPNNPFSSFPLFLDDILKPVLDLSPPPQQPVNGKGGPPPSRRGAPGRKTVSRPQLTVAQLITKHNLTWKDFIPHVPRITIPGIQLTVNLASLPAPPTNDPKKAAVMGETIAKLNDALKSIFPPAFSPANITKVELNINEQGIRPVIIDAQLPGWSPANKTTTDDQNQSKSFLDRLSAIFNKKEDEHKEDKKEGDNKVMNAEDKQKSSNNALVRFFYFISRRSSSSPLENAPKNASKPAIEGKTAAESAYSTSNDSNGAAALNLIPIWVLSTVFIALFNFY